MSGISDQAALWLRLSLVRGIGPMLGRKLCEVYGGIDALWASDSQRWSEIEGIGPALLQGLKASRTDVVTPILQQCRNHDISILCSDDPDWPIALQNIDDAPLLLFVKGDPAALNGDKMLAIVGARRASREGNLITRRWSRYFSDQGITIISGMAYGIDAAAHGGALEGRSDTIAVLGCGLLALTELQQAQLQAISGQGCVVSEFMPEQSARPEQFPRRNRIIAALARATLVVEADLRSGSLITARLAANYGREVFALPGSLLAGNHAGCHQLIRDGATLASDPASVMQDLGWVSVENQIKSQAKSYQPNSANEAKILDQLQRDSLHLDELSETCGLTIPELSPILLGLELQGVIVRLPGSRYQLSAE